MRTSILIVLFALIQVINVKATEPIIIFGKTNSITVNTAEWTAKNLIITISDRAQNVVFRDKIKNDKDSRKYNLKNLPSGSYKLEISGGQKTTFQNIEITSEGVILESEVQTIYRPTVKFKGSNLDVNILALENLANLSILDESGETVFFEDFKATSIQRRYNLDKLAKGSYTVQTKVANQVFYDSFSK